MQSLGPLSKVPKGYGGYQFKWSPAEKQIARKAFELALHREFAVLIDEVKASVSRIQAPHELWDLEHHLTSRRKRIDSTYDYRYSVLPTVLAVLIKQGRLDEHELKGLADDKIDEIHRRLSKPGPR